MKLSRIVIDFEAERPCATAEFTMGGLFAPSGALSPLGPLPGARPAAAPLSVELGPVGPTLPIAQLVRRAQEGAHQQITAAAEAALAAL